MAFGGLETSIRVYLSELSGRNFRFNSNAILNIIWASSQILIGFILQVVVYWRYLFRYGMGLSFGVFLVFGYLLLDESPKYLVYTNQLEECKEIL